MEKDKHLARMEEEKERINKRMRDLDERVAK